MHSPEKVDANLRSKNFSDHEHFNKHQLPTRVYVINDKGTQETKPKTLTKFSKAENYTS